MQVGALACCFASQRRSRCPGLRCHSQDLPSRRCIGVAGVHHEPKHVSLLLASAVPRGGEALLLQCVLCLSLSSCFPHPSSAVERCIEEAEQCGELLLPEAARAREAVHRWRLAAAAEARLTRALRCGQCCVGHGARQPVAARLGAVHAVQPACAGAASITASISAMLCGLHLVDHRQSVCSACRDGVGTAALSRAIKDAAAAGVKVGEARRLLKLMQASAAVAAVCGCSR